MKAIDKLSPEERQIVIDTATMGDVDARIAVLAEVVLILRDLQREVGILRICLDERWVHVPTCDIGVGRES